MNETRSLLVISRVNLVRLNYYKNQTRSELHYERASIYEAWYKIRRFRRFKRKIIADFHTHTGKICS